MLDSRLRPLIDPPLNRAGAALARAGFSANALTVGGFVVGLGAMAAAVAELFALGLVLWLLNRVADGLDGAVARHRQPTDFGGFLDIVLDFLLYSGIVFAFALADPERNALPAAFLIFSFVGTGSSFLAFAVMAERRGAVSEAQGKKSLYYLEGLAEGFETILVLALFFVFPGWFPALAYGFGAVCWLGTAARILAARQRLR